MDETVSAPLTGPGGGAHGLYVVAECPEGVQPELFTGDVTSEEGGHDRIRAGMRRKPVARRGGTLP